MTMMAFITRCWKSAVAFEGPGLRARWVACTRALWGLLLAVALWPALALAQVPGEVVDMGLKARTSTLAAQRRAEVGAAPSWSKTPCSAALQYLLHRPRRKSSANAGTGAGQKPCHQAQRYLRPVLPAADAALAPACVGHAVCRCGAWAWPWGKVLTTLPKPWPCCGAPVALAYCPGQRSWNFGGRATRCDCVSRLIFAQMPRPLQISALGPRSGWNCSSPRTQTLPPRCSRHDLCRPVPPLPLPRMPRPAFRAPVRWALALGSRWPCVRLLWGCCSCYADHQQPRPVRAHYAWLFGSMCWWRCCCCGRAVGWRAPGHAAGRQRFGSRLLVKLARSLPWWAWCRVGDLLVSYQFVSRSIESWFDVKVEGALARWREPGARHAGNAWPTDMAHDTYSPAAHLADGARCRSGLVLERIREPAGCDRLRALELRGQAVASVGQSRSRCNPERPTARNGARARQQRAVASRSKGLDDLADTDAEVQRKVQRSKAMALVP